MYRRNLFENSSSEDNDDPASKLAIPMKSTSDPTSELAIPMKSTGDYQVTVQYSETSSDSNSSSYEQGICMVGSQQEKTSRTT